MLAAVAAIQFAAGAWVLTVAPFAVRLGPVPVMARDVAGPMTSAAIAALLALALLWPSASRFAGQPGERALTWVAFLAAAWSALALVAPFFRAGFLFGHDGGVHQTYAFLFDRALRQGQFPVRWVEGIGDGRGQPLFNFYQVGFYYLVALVHAGGPALTSSVKLVIAGLWLTGPVLLFLLCRPFGALPALLGALVFA
jgi:hypothetical protein